MRTPPFKGRSTLPRRNDATPIRKTDTTPYTTILMAITVQWRALWDWAFVSNRKTHAARNIKPLSVALSIVGYAVLLPVLVILLLSRVQSTAAKENTRLHTYKVGTPPFPHLRPRPLKNIDVRNTTVKKMFKRQKQVNISPLSRAQPLPSSLSHIPHGPKSRFDPLRQNPSPHLIG